MKFIGFVSDRQKTEERRHLEDMRDMDRKRKQMLAFKVVVGSW